VKLLRPTHPYIPIGRGFLYLVAIIDWASRAVLAWRLSNTMDVSFCLAALEDVNRRRTLPLDRRPRLGLTQI
jgi:transposase InsO family protein